jgi:hypothetical protein
VNPKDSTPEPRESNILDRVADELDAAASQVPAGGAPRSTFATVAGSPYRFLSKVVYTTGYGISFGFVFPSVLLARMVPKQNALVQGMIAGGTDASAMARQSAGNVRAMLGVSDDPYRVQGTDPLPALPPAGA